MNETDRKALVDELAEAMMDLDLEVGFMNWNFNDMATACLPIIERLLAAADAPGMGLQNEITEWANARFGGKDDHQRFTKLQNEVAELGRLSVNNRDGIKDECADIMHLLFQYAYWYRFDLIQATRDKFEINKQRTWDPQPDGTFQHVKEATDE